MHMFSKCYTMFFIHHLYIITHLSRRFLGLVDKTFCWGRLHLGLDQFRICFTPARIISCFQMLRILLYLAVYFNFRAIFVACRRNCRMYPNAPHLHSEPISIFVCYEVCRRLFAGSTRLHSAPIGCFSVSMTMRSNNNLRYQIYPGKILYHQGPFLEQGYEI